MAFNLAANLQKAIRAATLAAEQKQQQDQLVNAGPGQPIRVPTIPPPPSLTIPDEAVPAPGVPLGVPGAEQSTSILQEELRDPGVSAQSQESNALVTIREAQLSEFFVDKTPPAPGPEIQATVPSVALQQKFRRDLDNDVFGRFLMNDKARQDAGFTDNSVERLAEVFNALNSERDDIDSAELFRELDVLGVTFDQDGVPILPEVLRVFIESSGAVSEVFTRSQRDFRRAVITTLTNSLQSAINTARVNGTASITTLQLSRTFQDLTSALAQLLSLEVFPDEFGVGGQDILTAQGLMTMLDRLQGVVGIQRTSEQNFDIARTTTLNRVFNNLSARSALSAENLTNPIALAKFFRPQETFFVPAVITSGRSGLEILGLFVNNPVFEGNFTNLFAIRDELFADKHPNNLTEQARHALNLNLSVVEVAADELGVEPQDILAWLQWAYDNGHGQAELAQLGEIPNDFDLINNGNFLDRAYSTFERLPRMVENGVISSFAWMEDQTGFLGTAVALGTGILAQGVAAPFLVPINTIRGVIEGDFKIAAPGFDLFGGIDATHDYLLNWNDMSSEDQRILQDSGFNSIWGSFATSDDLQAFNDQITRFGAARAVENNQTWLNTAAIFATDLVYDPFNVAYAFILPARVAVGGTKLGVRIASNVARRIPGSTRSGQLALRSVNALPGASQAAATADRAATIAGLVNRAPGVVANLDPLGLAAKTVFQMTVKPAGSVVRGSLTQGNRIYKGLANTTAIQRVTENLNRDYRLVNNPIRQMANVTTHSSVPRVLTEGFKSLGLPGGPAITNANMLLGATRRMAAKRIRSLFQQQITSSMRNTVHLSETAASKQSVRGMPLSRYIQNLDEAWARITGLDTVSTHSDDAFNQGLLDNANTSGPWLRDIYGDKVLDQQTIYFAEATKNVNLFENDVIKAALKEIEELIAETKKLDALGNDLDTIAAQTAANVKFEDILREVGQELGKLTEAGAQKAFGVESLPKIQRALSVIGMPISLLFLTSPRFLIRNMVGGNLLPIAYGLATPRILVPGSTKKAWAWGAPRGITRETLGAVDSIGASASRQQFQGSLLQKITDVINVRQWDRRIDGDVRIKVMYEQYLKQWDQVKSNLIDGNELHKGLRQEMIDLGRDEAVVDSFMATLRDVDDIKALQQIVADELSDIASARVNQRASLSGLLGHALPADIANTDLANRVTTRLHAVDNGDPEVLRKILIEEIEFEKEFIAGTIVDEDFTGVFGETIDDVIDSLVQDFRLERESLVSTLQTSDPDTLKSMESGAKTMLFSRLGDWALMAQEDDIFDMMIGPGGIFKGTDLENKFSEAIEFYKEFRKEAWSLEYGTRGSPSLGPEVFPTLEEFIGFARADKFSPGTYIVRGGGLKNASDERLAEIYNYTKEMAPENGEGAPIPYGTQNARQGLATQNLSSRFEPEILQDFYSEIAAAHARRNGVINQVYEESLLEPFRQVLREMGLPEELLPSFRSDMGMGIEVPPVLTTSHSFAPVDVDGLRANMSDARREMVERNLSESKAAQQESANIFQEAIATAARAEGAEGRPDELVSDLQKMARNLANALKKNNIPENADAIAEHQLLMQAGGLEGLEAISAPPDFINEISTRIRAIADMEEAAGNVGEWTANRNRVTRKVAPLQNAMDTPEHAQALTTINRELSGLEGTPLTTQVRIIREAVLSGKRTDLDPIKDVLESEFQGIANVARFADAGDATRTNLTDAEDFRDAVANILRLTEDIVAPRTSRFSPAIDDVNLTRMQETLTNFADDYRSLAQKTEQSARMMTDFATHNSLAANDIDFLLRFAFPWEWWMLRTLGKGMIRLSDRSDLIAGYIRTQQNFEEINDDLPPWMRNRIAIEIPGWPSFLGKGPLFDPLSVIFQFDFSPYSPQDRGAVGDSLGYMSGFGLAISPIISTAMNAAGLNGEFSQNTPLSTTPLEQWYNAGIRALDALGANPTKLLPARVRWTEHDAFIIERNVSRIIVENPGAYTQEQVNEAFALIDQVAKPGLVGSLTGMPILQGNLRSALTRSDNPLIKAAVAQNNQELLLSRDLGFVSGVLASVRSPLDQQWFDRQQEVSAGIREALLLSVGIAGVDGDGGLALRKFFEENPDAAAIFSRGDDFDSLQRANAKIEFFALQEEFFESFNKQLADLPLQGMSDDGIPVDIARQQILEIMFSEGPDGFDTRREGWIVQTGLVSEDVLRDKDFKSTDRSRDIFILYQSLSFQGFQEQTAYVKSLDEADTLLLEKELGNRTTNLPEFIIENLKMLDQDNLGLFKDNNGVIDWARRANMRDAILSGLPGELQLQIKQTEVQFKSANDMVRGTVQDFYVDAWLTYINLGKGLDRDARATLQHQFVQGFRQPNLSEITQQVRLLRPDLTPDEVRGEFDISELVKFSLFVQMQNEENLQELEILGDPFYSSSGEIVNTERLPEYKLAVKELEDWIRAKELSVPEPWTPELEFWFGSGQEGAHLLAAKNSLFEARSRFFDFIDGKSNDRLIGSFARTIPFIDEEMTIQQGLDELTARIDEFSLMLDAQRDPFQTISLQTGEQREVTQEEIEGLLAAQGGAFQGLTPGSIFRENEAGEQETLLGIQKTEAQEVAEKKLSQLQSNNRTSSRPIDGTALSKTDVLRLLGRHTITKEEAFERLLRIGYTEEDATLLVNDTVNNREDLVKQESPFAARELSEVALRAKARELFGSDRAISELIEVLSFGRTLSRISEKDLRQLSKFFILPGISNFEDWLDAIRVILAATRTGVTLSANNQSSGFRREIRPIRRFN